MNLANKLTMLRVVMIPAFVRILKDAGMLRWPCLP